MSEIDQDAQRQNRIQLLIIMTIALVTLGGSYLLFFLANDSGGWGTTNKGAFVRPATTLMDLGWQADDRYLERG